MPDDREAKLKAVHDRLKEIRKSKTVSLKPCSRLCRQILGFDGKPQEFKLRYYQVIGVFHMMMMKRLVLGDATGLGKTIETVSALAYLWDIEPDNKVMVFAPKSAIYQWRSEIQRFTTGVEVFVSETKAKDALEHRKGVYKAWKDHKGPAILILNYALLVRDWNAEGVRPLKPNGAPDPKKPVIPGILDGITKELAENLVVIFDEATAFKSLRTKTWEIARILSDRSHRIYGLTATLLKNRLEEGYAIYKVVRPSLFSTRSKFLDQYCYTRLKQVTRSKKIPLIIGYKNLDHFRETIDPFFLGRQKHEVSSELPTLTTRNITFDLNAAEDAKYSEALDGVLELGDGEVKDFQETKALVSLIYCQMVVNSLSMLKYAENDKITQQLDLDSGTMVGKKVGSLSSKEAAMVDVLTEELDGEKVIVYTRFASLVPRLQAILKAAKVKSVAITGRQNDKARRTAQEAFQDLESDTHVIFITAAGTEALNLQAAAAMIFYDAPWSWGDYVQALGRMIRIGSPHQKVLAYHLLAHRKPKGKRSEKTIDDHVLGLLRGKKELIDQVIGEAIVDALEFQEPATSAEQLLAALRSDNLV